LPGSDHFGGNHRRRAAAGGFDGLNPQILSTLIGKTKEVIDLGALLHFAKVKY
jgi:hypothetical protein